MAQDQQSVVGKKDMYITMKDDDVVSASDQMPWVFVNKQTSKYIF